MTQLFRTTESLVKSLEDIAPIMPDVESEEVIVFNIEDKTFDQYLIHFDGTDRVELLKVCSIDQYKQILELREDFEMILPDTFSTSKSIWEHLTRNNDEEENFFRPKEIIVYTKDRKIQEINCVPIKGKCIDKGLLNSTWEVTYALEVLREYSIDQLLKELNIKIELEQ